VKAPAFAYAKPASLAEVFELLERYGEEAKILAGGQSLIAAQELVERRPHVSREEIREHLSGNYCRCTGYQSIVDAVETVCRARAAEGAT